MAFNTTSFLAGVGSVVVVLSTGFAGGYFFASPDQNVPPNRLQRVASDTTSTKDTDAKVASVATPQAKPEVAATVATPVEAKPAQPSTTPSRDAPSSALPAPAPTVQQASTKQPAQPAAPAAPEQVAAQATPDKTNVGKTDVAKEGSDKMRTHIAEAKAASRKRADARRFAEQQRRQQELEVAAGAVRHIIHDRDGGEIIVRDSYMPDREVVSDRDVVEVDQAEPPPEPDVRPFNFFGR